MRDDVFVSLIALDIYTTKTKAVRWLLFTASRWNFQLFFVWSSSSSFPNFNFLSLSIPFHPRQLALALFHFSIKNEKIFKSFSPWHVSSTSLRTNIVIEKKYSRKKQSQAKADDTVDKQKMLCSKNKVKKNVYSMEDVSQEFLGRSLSPHCLRIPFLLPACRLRCVECAAEEKRERYGISGGP